MSAPGAKSLNHLIQSMSPRLSDETYTFATVPTLSDMPFELSEVSMLFNEGPRKGWTIIVQERAAAAHQGLLETAFPCKKISLEIHSSLDAVGFLAAITTRLAQNLNLGVNPVSAFYHDHLFIPLGKENLVLQELQSMAREAKTNNGHDA